MEKQPNSITFVIFPFPKFLPSKRKDPSPNLTISFIFPPLVHIRSRTKRCSKIFPQQHFREEIFFVSGNRIFEHSPPPFSSLCITYTYSERYPVSIELLLASSSNRTFERVVDSSQVCLRVKRLVDNGRSPRRDSSLCLFEDRIGERVSQHFSLFLAKIFFDT